MTSLISKLYRFIPGDVIRSDELDDEFNQIIDLLAGNSDDKRVYVQYTSATLPVLQLNQKGAGPIANFLKSGVSVLSINNTGQLVSSVAIGVAPFIIASTTKVTNLNADLV